MLLFHSVPKPSENAARDLAVAMGAYVVLSMPSCSKKCFVT